MPFFCGEKYKNITNEHLGKKILTKRKALEFGQYWGFVDDKQKTWLSLPEIFQYALIQKSFSYMLGISVLLYKMGISWGMALSHTLKIWTSPVKANAPHVLQLCCSLIGKLLTFYRASSIHNFSNLRLPCIYPVIYTSLPRP